MTVEEALCIAEGERWADEKNPTATVVLAAEVRRLRSVILKAAGVIPTLFMPDGVAYVRLDALMDALAESIPEPKR